MFMTMPPIGDCGFIQKLSSVARIIRPNVQSVKRRYLNRLAFPTVGLHWHEQSLLWVMFTTSITRRRYKVHEQPSPSSFRTIDEHVQNITFTTLRNDNDTSFTFDFLNVTANLIFHLTGIETG